VNSLISATALVPAKKERSVQPLVDAVQGMSLDDILAALVLPRDHEEYTANLSEMVTRTTRKKSPTPLKEITEGALETLREMQELSSKTDDASDSTWDALVDIAKDALWDFVKDLFIDILESCLDLAEWVFDEIIMGGIDFLVDWLIEPILTEALGFIGLNPELWPFVAVGAAAGGLIYGGYKLFFGEKDTKAASNVSKAADLTGPRVEETKEDIEKTQVLAAQGVKQAPAEAKKEAAAQQKATTAAQQKATTAAQARGMVQAKPVEAAAPKPAGAPVAVPSGPVDQIALSMLKRHEGYKTKPYQDSLGLWTIGIGHLIGDGKSLPPEWDREFSDQEVLDIFAKDYAVHSKAAMKIPGFDKLDAIWQASLIDITFNMGPAWWHSWKIFQQQLLSGDLAGAIDNLAGSKWAKQTKSRATDILGMLRADLSKTSGSTQVANNTQVQQTPGVKVANAQPADTATPEATVGTAVGTAQTAANQKNYINGPKGSLIAVS
jgi:lysozyme